MRYFLIYCGIGAAWQLGMWWYARRRFGAYAADAAVRIGLGRFAVLKVLTACVLWPLSMGVYFFQSRQRARQVYANEIAQYRDELRDKCPDCGGPLEAHTHEDRPLN